MSENKSNLFAKQKKESPPLEESSTLDLTLGLGNFNSNHRPQSPPPPLSLPPPPSPPLLPRSSLSPSSDVEDRDKEEDQSRPRRRPRMVWTRELHKKFVDVVEYLGKYDAVPKNILRMMGVEGMTRANIASHLQNYRRYLKETQGNSNGESSNPGSGELNLMAPLSFRHPVQANVDQVVTFLPVMQTLHTFQNPSAINHHYHHHHPHMQQQGHHFEGSLLYRPFEHPHFPALGHFQDQSQQQQQGMYLGNQSLVQMQRIGTHGYATSSTVSHIGGTESVTMEENGNEALNLFTTRDD